MAKLYDKSTRRSGGLRNPEELLCALNDFVADAKAPAVLEYGEEMMPLTPGEFSFEVRGGCAWIYVWHENRSLSRRIVAVERAGNGSLDCLIHRFGGAPGKLSLLDLDRPQTNHRALTGLRQSFGEQFRRMLFRQFPGWQIDFLSSSMDLQRSFSPAFPRARLTKGNQQIAALACPSAMNESSLLTFALLWFDYVARNAKRNDQNCRLCLFLPEDCGVFTAHRLRWLNELVLQTQLFRFNTHGSAGMVDPQDLGNLETRVSQHYAPVHLLPNLTSILGKLSDGDSEIGLCPELNGAVSVKFRGVEFARVEKDRFLLGLDNKQEVGPTEYARIEQFAQQLKELVRTSAPRTASATPFSDASECWLESAVRTRLARVDATLLEMPVHGQVLTFAGADRDLIDLLAVNRAGRLSVIELKTSEDIHLPVQALDYWIRIHWHASRGELSHLFPQISLSAQAPRLLLLAPAISFHPANVAVLRYFSPLIDVERVGINSDWKDDLKVVMRLQGASTPQSHGGS